jgi:hypothetical protein
MKDILLYARFLTKGDPLSPPRPEKSERKEKKSKEKAPPKRLYDNLDDDVEIIEKPKRFDKSVPPPPKLRKTATTEQLKQLFKEEARLTSSLAILDALSKQWRCTHPRCRNKGRQC